MHVTNALKIPIILDLEASGFGSGSYPIEVGIAIRSDKRFSSLIKPVRAWRHWDAAAEALHGISRELLLAHGKSVSVVAGELNKLLHDKTVFSDGWVVDKPWLTQLYFEAGMSMSFNLSPIELIMTEAQTEIWDACKTQVRAQLPAVRHRASHDAWIIQETYLRSRRQLASASRLPP